MSKRNSYDFPPIQNEFSSLFKPLTKSDAFGNAFFGGIESYIPRLKKIHEKNENSIQKYKNALGNSVKEDLRWSYSIARYQYYAKTKILKLKIKYYSLLCDYMIRRQTTILQLISFIEKSIETKMEFKFEIEKFEKAISPTSLPILTKLSNRITSLKSFLYYGEENTPQITNSMLTEKIVQCSSMAIIDLEYIPPNEFDELFYKYCQQTLLINKFHQLLVKIEENAQRAIRNFDFDDFNTFVSMFYSSIAHGKNFSKKELIVIRCASIRVFFDLFFIHKSKTFLKEPAPPSFFEFCLNAVKLAPADLGLNSSIIGDPMRRKEMREIMINNPEFSEASSHILTMQFFANPLDIAAEAYYFIKTLEKVAKRFTKMFNTTENPSLCMSFDDIFSLALPTFASQPVVTSISLERFLNLFSELQLSPVFEYGLITLKAIISHINDLINEN